MPSRPGLRRMRKGWHSGALTVPGQRNRSTQTPLKPCAHLCSHCSVIYTESIIMGNRNIISNWCSEKADSYTQRGFRVTRKFILMYLKNTTGGKKACKMPWGKRSEKQPQQSLPWKGYCHQAPQNASLRHFKSQKALLNKQLLTNLTLLIKKKKPERILPEKWR